MGRGGALRRRARRRSVRPAISGIAPQGNAPSMYARGGARRGRVNARNGCGCGRARGLGYEGYEGYEGYGGLRPRALARTLGTARRFATRATAVSAEPRLHAGMRRACGHARRADLSSRAGGFAPLGLRRMSPRAPHIWYRAGCHGSRGLRGERAAAR